MHFTSKLNIYCNHHVLWENLIRHQFGKNNSNDTKCIIQSCLFALDTTHIVVVIVLVRRNTKATSQLCERAAQRPTIIPSLSVWCPPSNTSSSYLLTYTGDIFLNILNYIYLKNVVLNIRYLSVWSIGVYLPFSTIFFLLYRTQYSVVTFLSIFSRSEHDGWMARRGIEVMSLEWHLEQWEAWDSHLTHHTMDSERIDSVNENIWLNPVWVQTDRQEKKWTTIGGNILC